MLKVEKKRNTEEVFLRLRENDKLFSKDFCFAFGWAFCMHLLGITLFSIGVLALNGTTELHRPVEVLADPFAPDSLVYNDYETDRKVRPIIPPPPKLKHTILPVQISEPSEPIAALEPYQVKDFSWVNLDLPEIKDENRTVELELTGPLSNLVLEDPTQLPKPPMKGNFRVTFHAYVDTRSGKVLGQTLQEKSGNKQIDAWAEKLLSSLQFQKNPHGYIQAGLIGIN